jgi:hypothetical protein
MNGGWQTIAEASGQRFPNQGECIAYSIHHPVSLSDLTGTTLTGTAIFTPANGCGFASQEFDGSYPGSTSVGPVTFHIAGCVNNYVFPVGGTYAGSFTITSNVGSVSGMATGLVTIVLAPPPVLGGIVDFDLTLSVQAGTGLFAGTTGSLAFQTNDYSAFAPPTFSGTIRIP